MRPFSKEHCRGKHVALRVFQPLSRFNDLDDWHFSDIAAPIGGVGERVTTRRVLAAALDCAVKRHGQFSLVEVKLPRGATSHTLARFVCGFKSVRERTAKTAAVMAS
jgi:indolepyruvate decarboxylase